MWKNFLCYKAALPWVYADTVIISAAGTNLDSVLSIATDSSKKALTKCRSQPWEPRHVLALVPNIRGTLPEEARRNFSDETATTLVTQWIKRVPVFRALTGNGRAAVKLVLVLLQLYTDSRNPINNVAGVVDSVSKYYIRGNGLKGLTINQRRKVVKAVLKVLQAPDLQVAAPVKFDVGDPDLKKSCHSLVDSNIDKDSQYFFSIRPGNVHAKFRLQVVNYKVIDIKKGKDQDPDEDEEADNTWVYGTNTLEVPNKFCERITFVICINAMSIELKLESEKVDARVDGDFSQGSTMTESQDSTTAGSLMVKFTLTPAHVDLKGTLKQDTTTEPLRRWIQKHAKAGVHVCFRFCRGG